MKRMPERTRHFFLLPRGLAQRVVDAVLPAGPGLLEVVEHVAVEAQRHLLLGVGDGGLLGGEVGGSRGRGLEGAFGGFAGVDRSSRSVCAHGWLSLLLAWDARNARWLPSQNGGCLVCLQPQNATVRFCGTV